MYDRAIDSFPPTATTSHPSMSSVQLSANYGKLRRRRPHKSLENLDKMYRDW